MDEYLKVYDINVSNKFRLGANGDGGYVIGKLNGGYDCYISAGVSDEESFSRDFIKMYNLTNQNSFAFDGTITNYPYQFTKNITFYKVNISPIKDDNNANLSYFMNNFNNIFLKMDIEGAEFDWLLSLTDDNLSKFKQIAIELHDLNGDGFGCTKDKKLSCLQKLSKTHYIIHAHANNYNKIINNIPDVIELTYVRKVCFTNELQLNKSQLPIPGIDFKNSLLFPEIDLNFPPFVN